MIEGANRDNTLMRALRNLLQEGPEGDRFRKRAIDAAKARIHDLVADAPPAEPLPADAVPAPTTEAANGEFRKVDGNEPKSPQPRLAVAEKRPFLNRLLEAETLRRILDPPVALQDDEDEWPLP